MRLNGIPLEPTLEYEFEYRVKFTFLNFLNYVSHIIYKCVIRASRQASSQASWISWNRLSGGWNRRKVC